MSDAVRGGARQTANTYCRWRRAGRVRRGALCWTQVRLGHFLATSSRQSVCGSLLRRGHVLLLLLLPRGVESGRVGGVEGVSGGSVPHVLLTARASRHGGGRGPGHGGRGGRFVGGRPAGGLWLGVSVVGTLHALFSDWLGRSCAVL